MKQKGASPDKWKTYLLTFTAYMALHAMRMTYSEVKPYFQTVFNLSNLYLGILDGIVYVSLALGFGLRFLISSRNSSLREYLIFTTIAVLGFLVIPVISLASGILVTSNPLLQKVLPAVGLVIFGFFQFSAWPTLLTITNEYFDIKTEGAAMGFWSSNANIGNIMGFALTGLFIDVFQFRWEVTMIIMAFLQLFVAFEVYYTVSDRPE
jgi:sugar phosphate permease